jgi:hypothetical protein
MSIAEKKLIGQLQRLKSALRGGRNALSSRFKKFLFYRVKEISFALLRKLDTNFVSSGSLVDKKGQREITPLAIQFSRAPAAVGSAVIINSNQAIVTGETFLFYLRGIFKDEVSFNYALTLLPQDISGYTFEEIDKKLEHSLLELKKSANSTQSYRMFQAFYLHKEMTDLNVKAYSIVHRDNPHVVFWPDPTDPRNGRSLYTELPFAQRIPLIDRSTRIVSAGSCFATEVAHSLQKHDYNYLVKEPNKGKPGSYEFLDSSELPNSSAAWGVIFNTPSFRQLIEKAFEVRSLPKILWTQEFRGKLRYLDPFRENIAFESPEAFEANYQDHLQAVREAFLEMEVFIITLGLNEIWYFKADGSVFSRSPWRTAPSLVGHRTLTVQENVNDLVRMTEILMAHNPKVHIICTLSPIALHATFRGDTQHVITANAHSKAVLRVAAEEFQRRCPNVYYFPAYEVVTSSTEHPWTADQRHVSPTAVKNVIELFHQIYSK